MPSAVAPLKRASSARKPKLTNPLTAWIADRSLNTKIMIIVAAMTLVAAMVGIVALVRLAELNSVGEKMYRESFVASQQLNKIMADVGTMHAQTLMYGQTPSPDIRQSGE